MFFNSSKKSLRHKLWFAIVTGLASTAALHAPAFAAPVDQPVTVSQVPTAYSFKSLTEKELSEISQL